MVLSLGCFTEAKTTRRAFCSRHERIVAARVHFLARHHEQRQGKHGTA